MIINKRRLPYQNPAFPRSSPAAQRDKQPDRFSSALLPGRKSRLLLSLSQLVVRTFFFFVPLPGLFTVAEADPDQMKAGGCARVQVHERWWRCWWSAPSRTSGARRSTWRNVGGMWWGWSERRVGGWTSQTNGSVELADSFLFCFWGGTRWGGGTAEEE